MHYILLLDVTEKVVRYIFVTWALVNTHSSVGYFSLFLNLFCIVYIITSNVFCNYFVVLSLSFLTILLETMMSVYIYIFFALNKSYCHCITFFRLLSGYMCVWVPPWICITFMSCLITVIMKFVAKKAGFSSGKDCSSKNLDFPDGLN